MYQRTLQFFVRQTPCLKLLKKTILNSSKLRGKYLPAVTQLQNINTTDFVRQMTTTSTTTNCRIKNVSLDENKGKIKVDWEDGKYSNFHSMWLRFNCRCEQCRDPLSNMPRVQMENIPFDMKLKNVTRTESGKIRVTWEEEDHVTEFEPEYLKHHCYSKETMQRRRREAKPNFSSKTVPEIAYSDVKNSDEGKYRSRYRAYGWCDRQTGGAYSTKAPDIKSGVPEIINIIGPIQSTYYGELYNVRLHDIPINLAYSNEGLTFHMDLQQYESPPGIQFLHCHAFDDHIKGGETLFLDMYLTSEEFRSKYPEHFKTLCRVPASFERIHNARDHPVKMIMKKPHFILNNEDEIIAMNWHFPPAGTVHADEEDMEAYYQAFHRFGKCIQTSPNVRPVRLRPGDLICFNNRRTAHARNPFQTGGKGLRFLQGGYANIDDFKSRLMTFAEAVGSTDPIKRCFNNDWL